MINQFDLILPVVRVQALARIEKGIQWSDIEHLLLFALSKKTYTTIELASYAGLPRVVVIEAIVQLMRVGWVDMLINDSQTAFIATNEGKLFVGYESLPYLPNKYTRKIDYIIDRMAGNVFSTKGSNLVPAREIEKLLVKNGGSIVEIRPNLGISDPCFPSLLKQSDELSVNQDLIYDGEKLESFVEESISVDQNAWLRLTYTEEAIKGIPSTNTDELNQKINNYIRDKRSNKNMQDKSAFGTVSQARSKFRWPKQLINIDLKNDIFFSGEQHKMLLKKILQTATNHIIIYSTFLNYENIEIWIEPMQEAVNRGVTIDLLWDYQSDKKKNSNKLREKIRERNLTHWIRLHDLEVGSHAKFIIYDCDENDVNVVIGSCNWLSNPLKAESAEVSIQFRSSVIVRQWLEVFDKLLPQNGQLNQIRQRILALASSSKIANDSLKLSEKPVPFFRIKSRILITGEHERIIEEACNTIQERISVVSHKAGNAIENQILIPFNSLADTRNIKCTVLFSKVSGTSVLTNGDIKLFKDRYSKINIDKIRGHGKILCWDKNYAVITSLNWLSKDDVGSNPFGEIGVYLEGGGIGDFLWKNYLSAAKVKKAAKLKYGKRKINPT